MNSLTNLQELAKLIENLEISIKKLEASYEEKNAEKFNLSKKEIQEIQKKISEKLK